MQIIPECSGAQVLTPHLHPYHPENFNVEFTDLAAKPNVQKSLRHH